MAKRCHLEMSIFIRFCMANGQALPVYHTETYTNYNFRIHGASWYFYHEAPCITLTTGLLTNPGLLFPGVCFVFVFDQTLKEHLCRDKSLFYSQITRFYADYQTWPTHLFQKFTRCVKVYGLLFLDCAFRVLIGWADKLWSYGSQSQSSKSSHKPVSWNELDRKWKD